MYEYTRAYKDQVDLYGFTRVNGNPKQVIVDTSYVAGSRSGNKVENWQELVRQGRNASSPYILDRTKLLDRFDGNAYQVIHPIGYPNDVYKQIYFGVARPPRAVTHVAGSHVQSNSIALSKLYKKLQSERQHWAGASFGAEVVDVIRQFGRPLNGLMALHQRWRDRVRANAPYLKAVRYDSPKWRAIVGDLWLEYSFGLGPLIKDTATVAEACARFTHEEELSQKLRDRIRSRGKSISTYTETTSLQGVGNVNLRLREHALYSSEYRTQYHCGLQGDFRAPFGSIDRLQELMGFRPSDFVPALWEAVPWSWLVDYFFNVQQILSAAVTPTDRVSWICRTDTILTTLKVSYSGAFDIPGGWSRRELMIDSFGAYSLLRTQQLRTIPTNLSVPPLYFRHPFGDLKKMANIAAVFLRGGGDTAHLLGLGRKGLG